ncbi:MAG: MFS transporter [Defluviitaleaceae bacterium]|nr:MFS transporter [Defluviitaleaceae bacterium]
MKKTSPLRYSVGMFGGSLPYNMFTAFMAFYYVVILGLDMRIFSLSLMIYTFLDVVDSTIYGFLSDRTRTRFGRRKPWLVVATLLFAVSFMAFFSPPSALRDGAFVAYFIVTMLLVESGMAMIQVNYNSLLPDLFRNKKERATANSMRQAWMFAATILGVALTPMITEAIGYPMTALIFGIISISVLLFMTFGVHEPPDYITVENPKFFKSVKEILNNKNFWTVATVNTLYSTTPTLLLAAIPFYITYALGLGGVASSVLLGTVFITATASLFVWMAIIKKFSLLSVWRLSLGLFTLALIPFYFATGLIGAVIGGFLVGVAMGGVVSTNDIVVAMLLDDDKEKYGQRREGFYQSIIGVVSRLSGLIRSFAFFMVFALYGFVSGDEPGYNPGGASRFLLVVIPLILMAVATVVSLFVKIKAKEDVDINTKEA